MMISLPQYFYKMNKHMSLIENDTHGFLIPNNQCDWIYNFTRISENTWSVLGTKDDIYFGSEEYRKIFTYDFENDTWIAQR